MNLRIRKIISCSAGFSFIFFILMARYTPAEIYFSRQYGLPCKQCHTKIPNLNEFGKDFIDNGYSLEKKVPKQPESQVSVESPAAVETEPHVPAVSLPREKPVKQSKEDVAPKVIILPPPTEMGNIYRGQSGDGIPFFSNYPSRANDEIISEASIRNAGTFKNKTPLSINSGKHAVSKRPIEKQHNNLTEPKPKCAAKLSKQDVAQPVIAHHSTSTTKVQPRNFEDCMDKTLIQYPQVKNGEEIMELLEKAKLSCSSFGTAR
jgi:hypothetical protein